MLRQSKISDFVDILVPVYNHENYLSDCIESLLNQSHSGIRIHIVDDRSSDNSYSIAQKFQDKFPDKVIATLNPINMGSGTDSILSAKLDLQGEFWAIIEGDDYWNDPKKLEKQIRIMSLSKKIVVVTGNTQIVGDRYTGNRLISPDVQKWNYLDLKLNVDKMSFFTHISSALWRRVNYKGSHGPFPEKYVLCRSLRGEVGLMQTFLAQSGGLAHNLNEVLSCYRYTGDGVWSSLSPAEQDQVNRQMEIDLKTFVPFKYKLSLLGKGRLLKSFLGKRILPRPFNES